MLSFAAAPRLTAHRFPERIAQLRLAARRNFLRRHLVDRRT
jgi:hypothetical protein